jgi:hypothetical protein
LAISAAKAVSPLCSPRWKRSGGAVHAERRVLRGIALGPAEMAHNDHGSASVEEMAQRRQGGADAAVVGDVAGGVERHVEIDPHQHPFAAQVGQVVECFLGHALLQMKEELTTEAQRHREEKKREKIQRFLFSILSFFFSVPLCLCG